MTPPRQRAAAGLQADDVFKTSRTITGEDIARFAALSGDYNPVHFDDRFAGEKKFPAPICHGLLAASLVTEIGGQIAWLASEMQFAFKGPVYAGDTLTCTFTITRIDQKDRAQASAVIVNQHGATVIEARLKGVAPGEAARKILLAMLSEGDPTNKLRRAQWEI